MATESVPGTDESDVESIAAQLGREIADLPEYQRFVETKEAVKSSERAQEKISKFEEAHQQYLLDRQADEATDDQVRTLQEIQSELNALPEMADHLEAQEELDDRLSRLNDVISAPLAIDFGREAGGCCED